MSKTFWNEDDVDHATYMESYGEGVGSDTRRHLFFYIGVNDSLLDEGCGPGWNFQHGREIEFWDGKYKGTDFSKGFIDACIEKYGNAIDRSWEVQDARIPKEKPGSWDVVLLQDIVEHTNGYEKPVLAALKIARKKVIVTFWRSLSESDEDDVKQSKEGYDDWCGSYSKPKLIAFANDLVSKKQIHSWSLTESNGNRHHDYLILFKEVE